MTDKLMCRHRTVMCAEKIVMSLKWCTVVYEKSLSNSAIPLKLFPLEAFQYLVSVGQQLRGSADIEHCKVPLAGQPLYMCSLFCCLQFAKLHVVIESAGGQVVLCCDDTFPSDSELVSDNVCVMWCDILSESDHRRHNWIQHVLQLLARSSRMLYYCTLLVWTNLILYFTAVTPSVKLAIFCEKRAFP